MRTLFLTLLLVGVCRSAAGEPVSVDLFLAADCPIANRYAPEIERLHLAYRERGVVFRLVFPDRDLDERTVRRHLAEYGLTAPFVIDRDRALVNRAKATITPEAVVFDPEERIVYRGRIDNRYASLGKRLAEATEFHLRDAIEAVLSGRRPAVAETDAVGCLIEQ